MSPEKTIFRLVLEVFTVEDPKFPNKARFGYAWLRFNCNVLHRFSFTKSYETPHGAMLAAAIEWNREWDENEVQKVEEFPK